MINLIFAGILFEPQIRSPETLENIHTCYCDGELGGISFIRWVVLELELAVGEEEVCSLYVIWLLEDI